MKPGDKVIIGPYLVNQDVDYSVYEGPARVIYMGKRHAIVYSGAKLNEGKSPVAKVPLCQLYPDLTLHIQDEHTA